MLLHHRFIHVAKKYSKQLAIIDRSTNKELDYKTMLIASLILKQKFKKYDRGFVGLMIPTSAGAALATLGALMSGRIPVMINYSTGAKQNCKFAQGKCNFTTIITSKALLAKIECPRLPGMVFLEDIMASVTTLDKVRAAVKAKLPAFLLKTLVKGGSDENECVMLFTSGSEKEPKAVPLSHRNISSNIEAYSDALGLHHEHRMLATLPYFHVFGLTTNLWTPLCHGMTFVTYANPIEYKTVVNIIRETKPTMMVGTPSFFWGYLNKSKPGDFDSLQIAVVGADKCPAGLRDGFMKKHNITLLEGYGTTETSPVIATNVPASNKPGSVGKPLSNLHVRIQNYETGGICRTGETGKILVKGPSVMKGYFDDLEETSMRIRAGWYDTGDMGYLDEEGYLWHAGRLKRFVKIGGEMVSLVRVEEMLSNLLPEEADCCVVELPDPKKGARIVAVVTQEVDKSTLLKKMSEELPNIALPKDFLVLQELPKMGSGKTDFRATTDIVRKRMQVEPEAIES